MGETTVVKLYRSILTGFRLTFETRRHVGEHIALSLLILTYSCDEKSFGLCGRDAGTVRGKYEKNLEGVGGQGTCNR